MRRLGNIALAAALALAWPAAAMADEAEGAGASTAVAEESGGFAILAGESEIEQRTDAYAAARAEVDAVDARIAEIQVEIDAIEAELPAQQARSDAGLKQRYIMQSNPLSILDSLLASESLSDFIKQGDYLARASQANLREFNRLRDMKAQLDAARAEQDRVREEASAHAAEAEAALRELQDERAQAQAQGQEQAREQAGAMGGAASVEPVADTDAGDGDAKRGKSGDAKPAAPSVQATGDLAGIDDGADWHADRDAFIAEWAPRIDAYLAGSPLAGQGTSFAAAAWKYGIDPRWSPAISNIESSKGAYCIRPHNAWGWGAADSDPYGLALEWNSWEQAIDAHVKGLASGYGYTVSMGKARTYCPPNWQLWYNTVLRDMASMRSARAARRPYGVSVEKR